MTQLDHAFGVVMKALEELKLAENTFVIFTADNGPEGRPNKDGQLTQRTRGSTGGLRGRKRDMYEGGIRVPGIVRWPDRVKPGTVTEVPVVGSDIFTTIGAIAGVKPPADRTIDGANLLPVFEGHSLQRAIFDLNADPFERRDLSCHGNPTLKTPNLDRPHAEAARFPAPGACGRPEGGRGGQRGGATIRRFIWRE